MDLLVYLCSLKLLPYLAQVRARIAAAKSGRTVTVGAAFVRKQCRALFVMAVVRLHHHGSKA